MNVTASPVLLNDAIVTTASGSLIGSQDMAAASTAPAAIGTRSAASVVPQPFTLALLNVMQGVPATAAESGKPLGQVQAAAQSDDDGDVLTVDAEAPVELLQQMLDGLLAANALPVMPVNPAVHNASGQASPEPGVEPILPLSSNVPAPVVQQQTTVGLPGVPQAAGLKEMTPTAPILVLHAGENAAITAAQPDSRIQVSGSVTQVATASAPLKLDAEESRWAQQLQSALGERLQVQVKDQIQHATIRLDPPDMGKIDISLHIENGRMQVTINASQGEVYRALQQVSNDLRQSLTEQNFMQVNVQVSSQGGQREGQQRPAQQELTQDVQAAAAIEADASARREDDSVLLTV
ncbi:flagellar hook-length control protein FliK [Cedecea davisae]|uniref:Flagellar hook-length control protein FliK n=1 Tax=Cedecea davisae TaxID=158484 RepID=A0ABS6DNU8_9ENTR|nr:flagellar hook-length control protein FliK [Cedecea davisae]MBU4684464.1 flagellar hook-length control protein FliK [Cedecea davisae]MBU4688690.1 flagellar hook-length control protein FliK [Cedecea davisae]